MNKYSTQPDLLKMIQRYHEGTATEAEQAFVDQYYAFFEFKSVAGEQPDTAARENMQEQMEAWLLTYINKPKEIVVQTGPGYKRLWPRVVSVAAAVAAVTLSIWIYTSRHPNAGQDSGSAQYVNDIAPGKNSATLSLANGKTINLSDAKTGVVIGDKKLAYNDGAEIPDWLGYDEVQTLTASTPRGGTYQVTLSDGTKVWLNADSKISFPSQFAEKKRKIMLSGEAYFEVYKDRKRPFIVESNGQEVTVLGTHFNINSYEDESSTKTTLLEGSVRVNDVVLKPNQQAILVNGSVKVSAANVEQEISWKNGYFRFNDEKIEDIMTKLARWYDIEVIYEGKMNTGGFTGTASRNKNISQVLKLLENTKDIHFKIEGRRVTVIN